MGILEQFKRIAVSHKPFDTEGNYNINFSKKVESIKNEIENIRELKSIDLDYIIHKKFGIILTNSFGEKKDKKKNILIKEKLNNTKLLIVSHIDLIKKFNKKFDKDNYELEINNGKISGALDNTITNAILLNILDKINLKDTMILFSIGEEEIIEEPNGAIQFAKKYKSKMKKINVLNLDVTSKEYHKLFKDTNDYDKDTFPAFIEYDSDKKLKYSKINSLDRYSELKGFDNFKNDVHFCDYSNKFNKSENGTADDLDSFTDQNIFGISFNLSTNKEIHSFKNYTTIEKISNYRDLLIEIIIHMKKLKSIYKNTLKRNLG